MAVKVRVEVKVIEIQGRAQENNRRIPKHSAINFFLKDSDMAISQPHSLTQCLESELDHMVYSTTGLHHPKGSTTKSIDADPDAGGS